MSIMSDKPETASAIYSTGQRTLYLDSLPQVIDRNPDGSVNFIQVTDRDGAVFRQTLTYASGQLTGISGWVRQ